MSPAVTICLQFWVENPDIMQFQEIHAEQFEHLKSIRQFHFKLQKQGNLIFFWSTLSKLLCELTQFLIGPDRKNGTAGHTSSSHLYNQSKTQIHSSYIYLYWHKGVPEDIIRKVKVLNINLNSILIWKTIQNWVWRKNCFEDATSQTSKGSLSPRSVVHWSFLLKNVYKFNGSSQGCKCNDFSDISWIVLTQIVLEKNISAESIQIIMHFFSSSNKLTGYVSSTGRENWYLAWT